MTLAEIIQVAGLVAATGGALLVWSMKRNVKAADATIARVEAAITAVASDVRQLASAVQGHETRLAEGKVTMENHGQRLLGLEERERERGCFGPCPARAR